MVSMAKREELKQMYNIFLSSRQSILDSPTVLLPVMHLDPCKTLSALTQRAQHHQHDSAKHVSF